MARRLSSAGSGSSLVISATIIAGIGGYAIVTLMARTLGENYGEFAVFWALLYLAIGTFSGIQQEVSRGTPRISSDKVTPQGVRLVSLSFQLALIVFVATSVAMVFFAPLLFVDDLLSLSAAVVCGATLSVFVGVLAGALYGTHSWRPLALLIVADVLFRLILLGIVSMFTSNIVLLAWVCTVPFVLVLGCVIPLAKSTINRKTALDVNTPQAYRNIGRTVAASFGTAVLVSGFPALLVISEGASSQQFLGAVIFALTLTRAPLVVGILALQSFLIVKFRDLTTKVGVLITQLNGAILIFGLIFSVGVYFFGNQVLVLLAGPTFTLEPVFLFVLTLSSVPTAWLAVTGAASLSHKLHTTYSTGWLLAALISFVTLFIPNPLETKLVLALVIGPLVGVGLNILSLAKHKGRN